ncbi:DUF58 domain-containing protein [bacterium]|nr:DUF58 domain-containing protein [bacterium]
MPSDTSPKPSLWKGKILPFLGQVRRLFPLKLNGFFLLGGAGLLLVYFGLIQQDLILLMASLVLTAVALLNILLVCIAAYVTHRWWKSLVELLPGELNPLLTGVPGRLPLARRPPWIPLVEVSWRWLEPERVQVSWGSDFEGAYEEFTFQQRCLITSVVREFEIADVLGFASIKLRRKQSLQLAVLPKPQPINRNTFVISFHGGEDVSDLRGEPIGDRVDMRQYSAGDPPKLMLWKLYARTGKLMVRQPERAISPTPRTCAYLVAGPQDEFCAGLLRNILESGLLGSGWRFGADGNQGYCERADEALTFLARSGNLSAQGREEVGLRSFLDQAAKDGFNGCMVGLPSLPGPWLDKVRQAASQRGIEVTFAAAPGYVPSTFSSRGPAWWHKVRPYVISIPPAERPGEPETVLNRLAGIGKDRWLYNPAQHGFVRYHESQGGKGLG